MIQIGVLTILGVGLGVAFGALAPLAFGSLISAALPIPADFSLHFEPLFQAAIYGFLTAILFTLWPLPKPVTFAPPPCFATPQAASPHGRAPDTL